MPQAAAAEVKPKKTFRASQAGSERVQKQRVEYWELVRDILAENLVFIDESGVLVGLQRGQARSQVGQRAYARKPFYRGSKVTVIGAITVKGVLAYTTLSGSMHGQNFLKFVRQELAPQLWPGAVVVMDNLRAHKVAGVVEAIEAVGARVLYQSPYSPEFNPIEHWWSQLKGFLRSFSPKTVKAVQQLIELAVILTYSQDFRNWFAHCCYCTK